LFALRMLICHVFLLYHRPAIVRKLSVPEVVLIPIIPLDRHWGTKSERLLHCNRPAKVSVVAILTICAIYV